MLQIIPHIERAAHHIALYIDRLPGLQVTQAEAHVLVHLATQGPRSVAQIHAMFGHKRSTLTSILDRLVERSLIVRHVSEVDRRSFVVQLTPAGRRIGSKLYRYLETIEQELMQRISKSDLKGFLAVVQATADDRLPSQRKSQRTERGR